ncbi:hypothetical protein TRAPUB_10471 [Trametes pubescens]|uniref:Tetraspanin Tsp2 n=1 Tax=Trametes pubescens TaxID=154538 RepID=A0A1M2VZE8_TRAPU|nr:hypothetical protein TRAPUB_10471 [Trametes pubescens]
MERRYPSTSSALTNRSSIRHRSAAYSPKTGNHAKDAATKAKRRNSLSEQSERTDHTLTVQVEDTDDVDRSVPTVLLVRHSKATSRLKPLPDVPCEEDFLTSTAGPSAIRLSAADLNIATPTFSPAAPAEHLDEQSLSPVPLTPRPPQTDRDISASSVNTVVSHALDSKLPTPDYLPGTSLGRRLTSYFHRVQSFRAARRAQAPAPPPVARTESDYSTYSEESTALSDHSRTLAGTVVEQRVPTAIKDKRPMLASSFSTHDKFTNKFPRPRSVKSLSYKGSVPSLPGQSAVAATMLEEGEGLGLELHVGRWTLHKWFLVLSVCTIFVYGAAGLICAILTWFRAWDHADVMYVADYDILVLITLVSSILLLTFLVGISGALLNSRPLLAVYALLLWPALVSMLAIGYTSYKRSAFALDRKLNLAWSQWYTPRGRLVIQESLRCCGFYSALHEAAASKACYPRTPLPGCKGKLWRVERESLALIWSTVFSLVPVHLLNIVVALLCANHVTRTFGKGLTPKRYRLSGEDVRADAQALMKALGPFRDVRPVARPGFTRAPSSGVFREDRSYYDSLDEWETDSKADTVGLGIRRR